MVPAASADGKILAGPYFHFGNEAVVRLNPSGARDAQFPVVAVNSSGDWASVRSLALRADGKILVAGHFFGISGIPRPGLARLHSNGSLDTSFDPGSGPTREYSFVPDVGVLELPGSRNILVWGDFTHFNGVPLGGLLRLRGDFLLPIIAGQPLSQTQEAGQTATFRVSASGPAPLPVQCTGDSFRVVRPIVLQEFYRLRSR